MPERVWVETERALGEDTPTVYFEVLRAFGHEAGDGVLRQGIAHRASPAKLSK